MIELPEPLCDKRADPDLVKTSIAELISRRTADVWHSLFQNQDVCCSIVATLEEAAADRHFAARRLFARTLYAGGLSIPALPVPIVDHFRSAATAAAPRLGADTYDLVTNKPG